jgi:hypothetical protein
MNAASGENLTGVLESSGVMDDTGGALGGVTDEARFCRTTVTCIWGVSDPLLTEAWAVIRGWQRGSLTPQMPPSLLLTAALTATRAAQCAAPCSAANSHTAKNIAQRVSQPH